MIARLRLAWAIARGDAVVFGVQLVPWAGPNPAAGEDPGAWVRISSPRRRLHIHNTHVHRPVLVVGGEEMNVPDETLPYIWRDGDPGPL